MKRKNKGFRIVISVAIITIMVLMYHGNIANAAQNDESKAPSENETEQERCVRLYAEDIARKNGVAFDEKTKIDIVPTITDNSQIQGNALVLTNIKDSMVTKDAFVFMDSNGPLDLNPAEIQRSVYPTGTTILYPSNAKYVVHGTAAYNVVLDDSTFLLYVQPLSACYTYYKNSPCSVSLIRVEYLSDGFEYSYPGFSPLGSNEVTHLISVVKYDPVNNTTYGTTNPYPSNKVLKTSVGSISVGNFLSFYCKVDGVVRSATIPFNLGD